MTRRRLSGGDIGQVWQIDDAVEKVYEADGLAPAEAAGLRWLDVPGGPPVPRVRDLDAHRLVLDHVPEGAPTRAGAETLGRELAVLHAVDAASWGCPAPGSSQVFLGWFDLSVGACSSWSDLWRARTGALLRRLPGVDPAPYDALADRLGDLVPQAGPRRVHGDLWSGNVLWDQAGIGWLIDPAAHGGHPELDVAMLALFGGPHLELVLSSWAEAFGPADGWRDRLALHQVHTLLFHAVAFGGGYLARAEQVVRRFG